MGNKSVNFSTDAGLIARLGQELVGKQETALSELIKNSYDADASQVDVTIIGPTPTALEIKDNGIGMTRKELEEGFLRIASTMKVRQPRSAKYKRLRAGRKGIGRFATERLGRKLVLTTRSENSRTGFKLTANWDDFRAGMNLDDVEVQLEDIALEAPGTLLRIEKLRDPWTESQFRKCFDNVMALLQPFPVTRLPGSSRADPGFQVRFLRGGDQFEDTTIADLQTEILAHAHAIIEARVDSEGKGEWRIQKNRFGAVRPWRAFHHNDEMKTAPRYENLRDASMKAYYFILQPGLLSGIVNSRVRSLLAELGGIRVYRNGFRVVPYGDPNDDWLGLDRIYGRRAETLAPIARRNFFGVVELTDLQGRLFEERTSREGLIDNAEFQEPQSFLSGVLVAAVNELAADRGRVGPASERSSKASDRRPATKQLRTKLNKLINRVGSNKAREELRDIDKDIRDIEESEAALVQEVGMLRFLASIGMATSEFTHEIRMTFQTFGLELDAILSSARKATKDAQALRRLSRIEDARERIEAFTGYFNEAMASRNLRTRTPLSLKRVVLDFADGIRSIVESQQITVSTITPPLDPLFTAPVHEAELSSVLLNFLTNSIKAIKRAGSGQRMIKIEVGRENDKRLLLRFSDTGDGIQRGLRDRIFDPFVTSQNLAPPKASEQRYAAGTGLGLWIVRQTVGSFGGEVSLGATAKGFVTTFDVLIPDEDSNDG